MTNNFSTIKLRNSSEKFILVRMKPGRSIENSLVLSSGTTYTMTFAFSPVKAIKVNGTSYTLVTSAPSSGQFSFSEDTKLITINLGASLTTQIVVAYYYLFYTDSKYRYTYEDPEDSTTTVRTWEPRLEGSPSFEITQQDIIDGFLTIGNTSISLINHDSNFQQYLGDNDSFSGKEIKIWQCLNSVENIQKYFFGYCTSVKVGRSVTLSLDNAFSILNNPIYSNETNAKSRFKSSGTYLTYSEDRERPIYKIYSLCSRTVSDGIGNSGEYSPLSGSLQILLKVTDAYRLINTNANQTRGTGLNRSWSACVQSDGNSALTENAASVVEVTLNVLYRTTVADATRYRPGDNVSVNGNNLYWVSKVDIDNNKIEIRTDGTLDTVLTNGDEIIRRAIPFVQIIDEDDQGALLLVYGRDYTISVDSNNVYLVTLAINFEANFATSQLAINGGLHPSAKIFYRVYNHDDLDHGTVAKEILEAAGLSVDTASVTAANGAKDIQANFSIPYFGEDNFRPARDYIEALMASCLSYLSIGSDFEIEYSVIDSFSGTSEITEDDFLLDSLAQEIDYKDIVTTINMTNKHGEYVALDPAAATIRNTRSEDSVSNTASKYLHELEKEKNIEYVVQSMTNSSSRISDLLAARRARLSFATKGINFSSIVGDNFLLVSGKVIGASGSKQVKIFTINKNSNQTVLTGLDLLGL